MGEEYFSLLPNRLVIGSDEQQSIINQIGDDKVILVLHYFYSNITKRGECLFSIESIVRYLEQKPNRNKGRINEKVKNIIKQLQGMNIVTNICPIEYKDNELVSCNVDILEKNADGVTIKFFKLYEKDIMKIKSQKEVDINNLLKLYCYLTAMMHNRENNKDIVVFGGKAKSCYPSYAKIHKDLGIKDTNIKRYIDILSEIDLIRYSNNGLHHSSKNINCLYESVNNYVLYTEDDTWKIELKESLKWHKKQMIEKGYVFIDNSKDKIIRQESRRLNGMKGYLTKQFQNGKISEEEYKAEIKKLGEIS